MSDEMSAEEHAREAERFAASAETQTDMWQRSVDLQAAQVHATLAQAINAAELVPLMAKLADWVAEPPVKDSSNEKGETDERSG